MYNSRQPRLPQLQVSPSLSTLRWPISPARPWLLRKMPPFRYSPAPMPWLMPRKIALSGAAWILDCRMCKSAALVSLSTTVGWPSSRSRMSLTGTFFHRGALVSRITTPFS